MAGASSIDATTSRRLARNAGRVGLDEGTLRRTTVALRRENAVPSARYIWSGLWHDGWLRAGRVVLSAPAGRLNSTSCGSLRWPPARPAPRSTRLLLRATTLPSSRFGGSESRYGRLAKRHRHRSEPGYCASIEVSNNQGLRQPQRGIRADGSPPVGTQSEPLVVDLQRPAVLRTVDEAYDRPSRPLDPRPSPSHVDPDGRPRDGRVRTVARTARPLAALAALADQLDAARTSPTARTRTGAAEGRAGALACLSSGGRSWQPELPAERPTARQTGAKGKGLVAPIASHR
jgi:hypothetical protein